MNLAELYMYILTADDPMLAGPLPEHVRLWFLSAVSRVFNGEVQDLGTALRINVQGIETPTKRLIRWNRDLHIVEGVGLLDFDPVQSLGKRCSQFAEESKRMQNRWSAYGKRVTPADEWSGMKKHVFRAIKAGELLSEKEQVPTTRQGVEAVCKQMESFRFAENPMTMLATTLLRQHAPTDDAP